ncbi:class I adenylate-forming enzyme family protein [Heyndrickxia coagulans]|uniref:class I adenylate-forming enzyme family protein n=2 Tax=Heyndrickxia coagulans TaxID=1398 RepID=UPI003463384A
MACHSSTGPYHHVLPGKENDLCPILPAVGKCRRFFPKKGIQQRGHDCLFLHNSDALLIAYYACQLGGFTAMPVNTKLAPPEVQYIFQHSEAKALIYDSHLLHILHEIPREFHQFQDRLVVGGEDTFRAVAGENTDAFMTPQIEADDTAVVFYTSGTTGRPKGVMLSAANVRAAAQIWSEAMDLSREDRVHIVTPLFHCAACHVFSIPSIYRGGTMIIEEQFSPEKTLETMKKEKVTVFFGVPAMYSILLNTPKMAQVDLSYLRLFCYGASPMPYERVRQVLYEMPEILEAAVVGIPHEIYGEVPKAYIVVKKGETLTEEKVLAHCSGKLAKYKWPAEMEFLQALPRNASGKVLKHVLRKQISGV